MSLTPVAPETATSHVACLTRSKGKAVVSSPVTRWASLVGEDGVRGGGNSARGGVSSAQGVNSVNCTAAKDGAPLAPRQLVVKKTATSRKSNVIKSPANHKSVVISKSPVVKKSIIIQHSSKPPVHIAPKPAQRPNNPFIQHASKPPVHIAPKPAQRPTNSFKTHHHGTVISRPTSVASPKSASRVILPIRPFKGDPKRNAIHVVKQPGSFRNKSGENTTRGSVVKLQRAVRPR